MLITKIKQPQLNSTWFLSLIASFCTSALLCMLKVVQYPITLSEYSRGLLRQPLTILTLHIQTPCQPRKRPNKSPLRTRQTIGDAVECIHHITIVMQRCLNGAQLEDIIWGTQGCPGSYMRIYRYLTNPIRDPTRVR